MPSSNQQFFDIVKLFSIGFLWFLSSALFSTWANTTFLITFKDPILHTFIRFIGSSLLGFTSLYFAGDIRITDLGTVLVNLVTPAVLLWIANYSNSYALKAAGITLTYIVKACIPVFTVIICSMQGQKFPIMIYISLIPICLGVALASGITFQLSRLL